MSEPTGQFLPQIIEELKKYSHRHYNFSCKKDTKYYIFEIFSKDDKDPGDQVSLPFNMISTQEVVPNFVRNIIEILVKRYSEHLLNIEGVSKIPVNRKVLKV